jgi:hypothetical protein
MPTSVSEIRLSNMATLTLVLFTVNHLNYLDMDFISNFLTCDKGYNAKGGLEEKKKME